MSQTPTPSQLLEIRRVKAMVAVTGSTINPQCFLGDTGPAGPAGADGFTGDTGMMGSTNFTFVLDPPSFFTKTAPNTIVKTGGGTAYNNRVYTVLFSATGIL